MSVVSMPPRERPRASRLRSLVPAPLRGLLDEVDDRTSRVPTRVNEYGYDPFGMDPELARVSGSSAYPRGRCC